MNTEHLENVHIVQGDISSLPFKKCFHIVYSIGVIHHLPSPYEGFKSLTSVLFKRGILIIWIYAQEGNDWIIKYFEPLRKKILSKIKPEILYYMSFPLPPSILVYLISRMPVKVFYKDYLDYISKFPFKEIQNIVYDQMNAPITHFLSRQELEKWINESKQRCIALRHHNKNSWTLILEKIL
ncbi:hypothetical protein HRbin19_01233 [bacterium HR19]|nr:hypothetical protein HRbin19_01233 [bacterium HR19]